MKILQISFLDPLSGEAQGVEGFVLSLSKYLTSEGNDVSILCVSDKKDRNIREIGKIIGIKVPEFSFIRSKGRNVIRKIIYNSRIKKFLRLNGKDFDIIHIHGDNGGFAIRSNHNSVMTLHGFQLSRKGKYKNPLVDLIIRYLLGRYELKGLKKAKAVTAISESVKKEALKYYLRDISVINPGLELDKYIPADQTKKNFLRNKYDFKPNVLQILFVGKDPYIKGADIALEVLTKLNEINGLSAELNMIGVNKNTMTKYISSYENIRLFGHVSNSEKIEIMQASDFLLFPTRSDPFPVTIFESIACGLPAIVSGNLGNRGIFEKSKGAFVIDKNLVVDYISIFEKCLVGSPLYKSMQVNGQNLVRNFNWKALINEYIVIYSKVLVKNSIK